MDTKQASKKWECSASTVKRYCKSGIIPPAEKIRNKWVIPDNCEKPPLTRRGLCYLMDTIYQIKDGVDVENITWGYSEDYVRRGYNYLISFAFITFFNVKNLESDLGTASVTPRGKELIIREYKESKGKYRINTTLRGEINIGLARAEIETEILNNK